MKIFYITNARIPTEKAHGYQISKMCEEFSRVGLEVELWLPTRFNHIKEDLFDFYDLERNFKVKYIKSFDFFRFERFLDKYAFYLQSIWYLLHLRFRRIDKEAIIYTRNPEVAWFLGAKKNRLALELHYLPERQSKIFNSALTKADKLIALTGRMKKIMIEKYSVKENKILVAHDAVDIEKFDIKLSRDEAREKLNLPKDKKIVLYTGHLYKWKGVDVLAETAGQLDKNTIVYFVGGTETDQKSFSEKYKELINKKRIVLIPHQPHYQIPTWLKAADVLILPNTAQDLRSKYYTSPMKLFEYMASGRPIIASSLPSFGEITKQEPIILFESDNPADLAQTIKNVDINKKFAYRLENYSWSERVNSIKKFIKK